jgi:hypothetical protein
MSFIEWVEHEDKIIFKVIQTKLSAPLLDSIMLIFRNPITGEFIDSHTRAQVVDSSMLATVSLKRI